MPSIHLLVFITIFTEIQSAKILTVVPQPTYSHHLICHPIHDELIRRGHEVTYITTHPAYPEGKAPKNLTEVFVGRESQEFWSKNFNLDVFGKRNFRTKGSNTIVQVTPSLFGMQLGLEKVREAIERKDYDLLILQGWFRSTMLLSHLHKIPVVKMSSMTMIYDNALTVGAPNHPLYHPSCFQQRLYNLSISEQILEVYDTLMAEQVFFDNEDNENAMLRKFYKDMPDLSDLNSNVDLLSLSVQSLWDKNRPLPPNVVYFGFVHQKPPKPLPKDIQLLMDSSQKGVIYMSFGTNITPSKLPLHVKNIFLKVLSSLPYDVLWKFDEELPNCPKNIKTSKWFPQSDIFRHPNLKLIITQGGLQTAEEAINAGVPVVCIPFLGDQWLNGENFVHYGVGKMIEVESITEELFREAVVTVIEDESYRTRMARLRSLVHDHPQPPLQRIVWWLEYILKHGGAKHLRSQAANLSPYVYYEVELLVIVISLATAILSLVIFSVCYFIKKAYRMLTVKFSYIEIK